MPKAKVHPDQQEIPGSENADPKNPRIINAAKRYIRERDARIGANQKEKDAHEHLMKAMKDEGFVSYSYGGIEVYVDVNEKCKVKGPESNADAGEE